MLILDTTMRVANVTLLEQQMDGTMAFSTATIFVHKETMSETEIF
jgi:hypothetical protein